MKLPPLFPRYACLLLLVLALSGCSLGGRRSGIIPNREPNQPQQQAPQATPTPISAGIETAPATQNPTPIIPLPVHRASATAVSEQKEDPGQMLIDQLNALDTANQAGDSFDDLP